MVQGAGREVGTEERVEHRAAGHGGRHGEVPGGEALADHEQIGSQPALLRREQGAGAPEAGGDLVADQQHVVLAARGAERAQTVGVGEQHPRRALHHWFDDHRRQLGRVRLDHRDRGVEAAGIAEVRRPQHREAQRVEEVGAEAGVAHRERAQGVAVVRTTEGEELRTALDPAVRPVLEGDLQRLLDRGGAVGREEEVRVVDRYDARERLGQLDHHHVAVAEHGRVRAAVELRAHRVVELGHVVAERVDPQRRDGVEVAPTVDVDQLVALTPLDQDRRVLGVRVHLGEAVPHDRGVTRDPLVMPASRFGTEPAHDVRLLRHGVGPEIAERSADLGGRGVERTLGRIRVGVRERQLRHRVERHDVQVDVGNLVADDHHADAPRRHRRLLRLADGLRDLEEVRRQRRGRGRSSGRPRRGGRRGRVPGASG